MVTANTGEMRAWAKAQGYDVGDRGRISVDVQAAFRKATGGGSGTTTRSARRPAVDSKATAGMAAEATTTATPAAGAKSAGGRAAGARPAAATRAKASAVKSAAISSRDTGTARTAPAARSRQGAGPAPAGLQPVEDSASSRAAAVPATDATTSTGATLRQIERLELRVAELESQVLSLSERLDAAVAALAKRARPFHIARRR